MRNIVIDTNYNNYNAQQYYSYESLLHTPVKEVLDGLLKELDVTKLYNGKQFCSTNDWNYENNIEKYIRILFTIPIKDFILYNHYVELLFVRHQENIDFESNFNSSKELNKSKPKTNRKKKPENKYIRMESHNLFTGELEYNYINYATGDDFFSTDPNLLEELNAPKKKNKIKKVPRKDFGKIILNFNLK